MRKWQYFLLAIISGGLLTLGWPPLKIPILLFIGFIPLFWLEDLLVKENRHNLVFPLIYLGLLIWNIGTTWWVWYASPGGAIAMLLANTFLMTLPFWFYSRSKKILGAHRSLLAFVLYWLSFEYLHHNWEISYPWLTLGNGLSTSTELIQWYEYTGVSGGTLWILLINVLLFDVSRSFNKSKSIALASVMIVPVIWSFYLGNQQSKCPAQTAKILVLQPNIDPYIKFNEGQEIQQIHKFIERIDQSMNDEIELIVLPETAIVEYLDEGRLDQSMSIQLLQRMLRRYEGVKLLTGASTYKFFKNKETATTSARQARSGDWYDSYNTALLITSDSIEDIYHKSKLVPGVERMPYPRLFGFLEYFAIDMGGISGSLGMDSEANPFEAIDSRKVAPLICYESIFGDYARDFVSKGADLIFVITNDGWWRDTPGYHQHMHYARMRAIENRREVVRCANTGISCHIDDNGKILEKTKWWVSDEIEIEAKLYGYQTFYTKSGDVIGKVGAFLGVLLLLSVMVRRRVLKSEEL